MRLRPRALLAVCVGAALLLLFALRRCPPGARCTPVPPPASTDESGQPVVVRTYPKDAGWRTVCYPWDPPARCERDAAEAAACSRDEVISRFHRKYGVLWMLATPPDGQLRRAADGTVTVTVINHGLCQIDCATHLWALLTSTGKAAKRVIIAAHELKQLNESAIALVFAVPPHPGPYSLSIEQRFWHGDTASVESRDFNFAARNLDLASYWVRFGKGTAPSEAEFHRLLAWQKIRSSWIDSQCLQILGSPHAVRVVPHEHSQESKGATVRAGAGKLPSTRRCTIEDLGAPGAWVWPLPDYLLNNSFVGTLGSAFEPSHCQWSGFDRPELDQCLARIDKFYIVGDSLMRMKVQKLLDFGVPKAMIEGHVKRKGAAANVPTMTSLRDSTDNVSAQEMAASKTRFSVVVDDLGLLFDAWHGTLASFTSRLEGLMDCAPILDYSMISVFYATHHMHEYRGDRITPPRIAHFNKVAATLLRQRRKGGDGTFVFDTQMPTRARTAVHDSEDGLHYRYTRVNDCSARKSVPSLHKSYAWHRVLLCR